jgi:diguanylate cyclase (GGDEF)-like protein
MASVQLRRRGDGRPDPLSREALFRQVGALVGAVLLGFLSMAVREVGPERTGPLVQASTVTAATVVATLVLPWHRIHNLVHTLVPYVFLIVAYLARAATGGVESAYAPLALLPIFWVAIYGSRLELGAMVLAAAAVLSVPLIAPNVPDQAWVSTLAMLFGGTSIAFLVHRFFNQIRHQKNRLQVFAGTDPLTGAANRRAWDEELALALVRSMRDGLPMSMALIDLDDFKGFNDQHGHQAGDRLLKESAAAWRGILRASDVLARIGGDEFAILLPGCALEMAASIADRLRAAVPASAGCSVGVAMWQPGETSTELVARADRALYEAKERGRDRVVITSDDGVRIEVAGGVPRAYRGQPEGKPAERPLKRPI